MSGESWLEIYAEVPILPGSLPTVEIRSRLP